MNLSPEEAMMVSLVRESVDRDVRPVVRDLDHSNTCLEALIERMKECGIYGLAVPKPYGEVQKRGSFPL